MIKKAIATAGTRPRDRAAIGLERCTRLVVIISSMAKTYRQAGGGLISAFPHYNHRLDHRPAPPLGA